MPWIRSQDGLDLSMVQSIWILKNQPSGYALKAMGSKSYVFTIGKFSTKDGALAALDDIQKWISKGAKGVHQIPSEEEEYEK